MQNVFFFFNLFHWIWKHGILTNIIKISGMKLNAKATNRPVECISACSVKEKKNANQIKTIFDIFFSLSSVGARATRGRLSLVSIIPFGIDFKYQVDLSVDIPMKSLSMPFEFIACVTGSLTLFNKNCVTIICNRKQKQKLVDKYFFFLRRLKFQLI